MGLPVPQRSRAPAATCPPRWHVDFFFEPPIRESEEDGCYKLELTETQGAERLGRGQRGLWPQPPAPTAWP